jgi:spore germination protein KB
MLDNGKITPMQMLLLLFPTIVATAVLLVPSVTERHAGRDMWLSPIWAMLAGFAVVLTAWALHRRFPDETLIEIGERVLGKAPGRIVGIIYVFFYWHAGGMLVRQYGEFVSGVFLMETPTPVIMGGMLVVCAYAVRGGVEVLGRCAQIIIPAVLGMYALLVLLQLPSLEPGRLLPMFEFGILPSLKGSIVPQAWYTEFIAVSFLYPSLTDRSKGLRWAVFAVLLVAFFLTLTNLVALMLFGEMAGRLVYPVMSAARYIVVADFLEHLEAFVMAIWVFGTFVKIALFYHLLVQCTARTAGLSDWRPIAMPVGLLILLSGIWSVPNLQEMIDVLDSSSVFELVSVQLAIPVLLLLVALIRGKKAAAAEAK